MAEMKELRASMTRNFDEIKAMLQANTDLLIRSHEEYQTEMKGLLARLNRRACQHEQSVAELKAEWGGYSPPKPNRRRHLRVIPSGDE
jgi:hypothetical protein